MTMAETKGDRYQVVGECAHVVVTDISGVSAVNLLYKGAFLPDGVDEDRLKHLLDTGLVAKVDGEPIAPNAAIVPDPPADADTEKADSSGGAKEAGDETANGADGDKPEAAASATAADQETERRRAEAKATLPADGSAPDGRASEAVWVEYAVSQGIDRGEAEKAGKAELRKALGRG